MPLYNTPLSPQHNTSPKTHQLVVCLLQVSLLSSFTTISLPFFYRGEKMSQNGYRAPNLELKLNLSPPRSYVVKGQEYSSPITTISSMEMSPPSSCGSSNLSPDHFGYPSSPDEAKSMMLVACPQCLMYVMSSKDDPKCPKCKTTVLFDFLREEMANHKTKRNGRRY